MAVSVTINGTSYSIPQTADEQWGDNVTSWIQAASQYLLQRSGGTFTLSADVDFGGSAGLLAKYFTSRTTNAGTTGVVRLANNESVVWRNAAGLADLALKVTTGDALQFNGGTFLTSTGTFTASRAAQLNASNQLESSSVTITELGYLSGLTGLPATSTALTAHTGASAGVHGLTGTVVGTTDSQTLSSKTLTTPTANGLKLAQSTKSANYTLLATDNFVAFDTTSAGRTATLPAATGNAGTVYSISKTDSTFNIVTITDSTFTTTLNTQGECVTLQSDGTTYQILSRRIPNVWVSYTPTCQALGTLGTTSMWWRRVGDSVEIRGRITIGTPTAVELRIGLPTGLTSDSTKVTALQLAGSFICDVGSLQITLSSLIESGVTYMTYSGNNGTNSSFTKLLGSSVMGAGANLSIYSVIPISGWNG